MVAVARGNLAVIVSGPGRTDALDVQKVRAPFTGTLESLKVVIGDRVESGQDIGAVVSQPSQAALTGAQVMLGSAKTATERSDAERALELAKQNLVQTPLRAPRAGVVISRSASQGDLLSQGDSIVSIASARSIVFIARVAQSDLARIRPGQRATIDAPGRAVAAEGVVHGLLSADTGAMSVAVRIDLRTSTAAVPLGLFGTAHITVAERSGVSIVPAAAVLRDDVNGTSRVAVVASDGRARWMSVEVGVQQGDSIEIVTPRLEAGARVIISGQVGLPDGSHVREAAADSTTAAPERALSAKP
jgi:HlyD family secretion protein